MVFKNVSNYMSDSNLYLISQHKPTAKSTTKSEAHKF